MNPSTILKLPEIGLSAAFGALIMFLLMRGCSTAPEPTKVEYRQGKTVYDTIYRYDTIKVTKPIPYAVTRYVQTVPDSLRTSDCDSLRYYRGGLDSAGIAIAVTSEVRGVLLSQEIAYRLPQVNASRTDTLLITNTRNYRYGVGVLYDGVSPTIIGQYGMSRNAAVYGGYNTKTGTISIGAGVRF